MSNHPDFTSHGYQIIRELGRNREAGRIIYLATDLNKERQVVTKEFRFAIAGADWSGYKAYQREIELLQQLNHPRIPRYLDSFETSSGFCLVQEYKNAPSLAERRSFTPEEIQQIAVSVLEILVYLQKRTPPLIHRDIKPDNILVDKQLNAYLIDFGFARIRGGEMALSSVAAGTVGFMPPEEQFGRSLTEASDLYSLGATLICLLTGTRSVDAGKLIDDNYRFEFKKLVPKLKPRFVEWLTKMVEPNLKNRYADAAVALAALRPIDVVGNATWLETLGRAMKPRIAVPVVGLAILGVFAVIGTNLIGLSSKKAEKTASPKQVTEDTKLTGVKQVQSSLVAYWNFDLCQGVGKPLHPDELDNLVQGTSIRGVTCANGRFGYSGYFDGVDDLIEIPSQSRFNFTNQMTVAAWVKPLRISGLQTIVNKWYAKDSYMLLIEDGKFVFTVALPGGTLGTPVKVSAAATTGVWTHVVGVFNGQKLLIYINGQLADSVASSGTLQASERPIAIGNHPDWNAFQGFIDEVRLYNSALDNQHISELSSPQSESSSALDFYRQGYKLGSQLKFAEALAAYEKSIQLNSNYAEAYAGRSSCLNGLYRYSEALAAIDRAIQINPNNTYSWSIRGFALENLERYGEALKSYDTAIQLRSDNPNAIEGRKRVLESLRQ